MLPRLGPLRAPAFCPLDPRLFGWRLPPLPLPLGAAKTGSLSVPHHRGREAGPWRFHLLQRAGGQGSGHGQRGLEHHPGLLRGHPHREWVGLRVPGECSDAVTPGKAVVVGAGWARQGPQGETEVYRRFRGSVRRRDSTGWGRLGFWHARRGGRGLALCARVSTRVRRGSAHEIYGGGSRAGAVPVAAALTSDKP